MMATGDTPDIAARLRATLPPSWFPAPAAAGLPSTTPVLDAVLTGCANGWAYCYALLAYVRLQTRIATATDVWLDAIAVDYFGGALTRFVAEGDPAFSLRIRANLLPKRATRAAVIATLTALTGRVPLIFEPADTGDTGGYGGAEARTWSGLAYGAAGGWGSLALPFQAFVTAFRPHGGGVANVAGYYAGSGWAGGGYGQGAIEYVSASMTAANVPDAAIYQTAAATAPAGTTLWTRIES